MGSYNDFIEAIGQRESSGRYDITNKQGYLGKYQMGEAALVDLGYYKRDGNSDDNRFTDKFWTGKEGIRSKKDFLANHQAQENAIRAYMERHWNEILQDNLDDYADKTTYGIEITVSGMLAGAHLGGFKNLVKFLKTGFVFRDKNKVPITQYITQFAGYDTPFKPRKKLTGAKKNDRGQMILYQVDNTEWVTRSVAIKMVKEGVLDAVIVTNAKGTVFLRTRHNKTTKDNLVENIR